MQQTITLAEQCRQRILTALLKDRCKVTSILKEGSNYLEKEDKVLFGEGFQKKVHETIKLKNKTKELFREYTKPEKRRYSGSGNHNSSRHCQGGLRQRGMGRGQSSIGYRSSQATSVRTFSSDG